MVASIAIHILSSAFNHSTRFIALILERAKSLPLWTAKCTPSHHLQDLTTLSMNVPTFIPANESWLYREGWRNKSLYQEINQTFALYPGDMHNRNINLAVHPNDLAALTLSGLWWF